MGAIATEVFVLVKITAHSGLNDGTRIEIREQSVSVRRELRSDCLGDGEQLLYTRLSHVDISPHLRHKTMARLQVGKLRFKHSNACNTRSKVRLLQGELETFGMVILWSMTNGG